MTLAQLAERCERATGPDRELDAAIAIGAAGWKHQPHVKHNFKWHNGRFDVPGPPPRYTASLDAAMTLVPEGSWTVKCETWPANPVSEEGAQTRAELLECSEKHWGKNRVWGHNGVDNIKSVGDATTLALALCAAALRARAAQAIEAGTVEMPESDSVHESAVPKGCAP